VTFVEQLSLVVEFLAAVALGLAGFIGVSGLSATVAPEFAAIHGGEEILFLFPSHGLSPLRSIHSRKNRVGSRK
jgi:hypothetical protein